MNLNERMKQAKQDAIEECERRGFHNWNHKFGTYESGGGELITGYCGGPDIPDPEYTDIWFHYARICVDCGHKECVDDANVWRHEEGFGHYECDPRTGDKHWVAKGQDNNCQRKIHDNIIDLK